MYSGLPVIPVVLRIADPSASIFPSSEYQSGAPLVPSSPCRTPFFILTGKLLTQARAVLPSGFTYSWKSILTDQVPSKAVVAAFVFATSRVRKTNAIRDADFINIA